MSESLVHTPQKALASSYEQMKFRNENPHLALTYMVPEVDKVLAPLWDGETLILLGRPGNLKTTQLLAWALRRERAILERERKTNTDERRVVLYCTAEQVIESMQTSMLAAKAGVDAERIAFGSYTANDWKLIDSAYATMLHNQKVWFIGNSATSKSAIISPSSIYEAIEYIKRKGLSVDSIFIDYIQIILPDTRVSGMVERMSVVYTDLINVIKDARVPAVIAAQARREVDDYKSQIPTERDGQWGSVFEQNAFALASTVYPMKYARPGDEFAGRIVSEDDALLVIWKQRNGPPNKKAWVKFDVQQRAFSSVGPESMTFKDDYDDFQEEFEF